MTAPLWTPTPDQIERANMTRFIGFVNERYKLDIKDFSELYDWSITSIADFWTAWWDFSGIIYSKPYTQVVDDPYKMPAAKWFEGAELNFAQNLLRYRDDQTALVFHGEGQTPVRMTYAELYDQVARLAKSLKAAGRDQGRPGGRIHAQHAPDRHRHAGRREPGSHLVLLLSRFRYQGRAGPFRPDRTQSAVYCGRLLLQRQIV
jgi:hypothetical protein